MKYLLFLCLFGFFGLSSYADEVVEITDNNSPLQKNIEEAISDSALVFGVGTATTGALGYLDYRSSRNVPRLIQTRDSANEHVQSATAKYKQEVAAYEKRKKAWDSRMKELGRNDSFPEPHPRHPSARIKGNEARAKRYKWKTWRQRGLKYSSRGGWILSLTGTVGASYMLFRIDSEAEELEEIKEDGNCCVNTKLEGVPVSDDELFEIGQDLGLEGKEVYIYKDDNQ